MKRNRFVQLSGGTKSVHRTLDAKARALAGLKRYIANLAACRDGTPVTADFVIGSYHRLFNVTFITGPGSWLGALYPARPGPRGHGGVLSSRDR